jgi:membrane peptidoglycan carboxypeptidase
MVAVVLAVAAVVGVVVWRSHGDAQPGAPASPAARASELYAADGTTLIARFDTDDPRESCLRTPVNDWGYFCDYVVTWWLAQDTFGDGTAQRLDRLRHGGYRIGGSLDPGLQAAAKQRVDAVLPVSDRQVFSLAAIEPGTGLVKTMAVNRNFRRPPAPATSPTAQDQPVWRSAGPDLVDPLVAGDEHTPGHDAGAPFMMFTLAAALEGGLTLDHAIDTKRTYASNFRIDPQSPVACNGGHWCPANTGDPAYLSGRRTMWDAFGHSVVTYFVALEERIGTEQAIAMAKRLGIAFRAPEDKMLSQSGAQWGAFTLGVSATTALDLAGAYATLAADGTHCDPLPVARLADAAGRPVPGAAPRCEPVLRAEVARAAIDAGRCPLGDHSAFGDRCGAGAVATTGVRGTVGRPVAGQYGLTTERRSFSVVIAAPQLVTAGTIGAVPGTAGGPGQVGAGVPDSAIGAVAGIERDGLAPLPARDFTAPPREVALSS